MECVLSFFQYPYAIVIGPAPYIEKIYFQDEATKTLSLKHRQVITELVHKECCNCWLSSLNKNKPNSQIHFQRAIVLQDCYSLVSATHKSAIC